MTVEVMSARTDLENPEIGLRDDNRRRLAQGLRGVLADTYLLLLKTHSYHWNVVGPLFVSLHGLTETQYRELFEASDTIAERIRALGYPAPLGFAEMIPHTRLAEESQPRTAEEMIENLVQDHEAVVRNLRATIDVADEQRDHATADLLTERMAVHEQSIWMLRALLSQ